MNTTGLNDTAYQQTLRDIVKRRERQVDEDIKSLMGTKPGRRFVYWLVYNAGSLLEPSFDFGVKDGLCSSLHTAHREGSRKLAWDVLERIRQVAPGSDLTMLAEATQDRQADLSIAFGAKQSVEIDQ